MSVITLRYCPLQLCATLATRMKVWPVSLAENVAHLLGNQAVNVVHILCSIYSVLRDKPHRGYTATNADPGNASNPCLTSTLSVTATSSMTSSVIQVGTRSLAGQITIVKTQITVQSIGENDICEIHCLHLYIYLWFVQHANLSPPMQPLLGT